MSSGPKPNGQRIGRIVSGESAEFTLIPFQVVVIELGVAVIDNGYQLDDVLTRTQIRIQILDLNKVWKSKRWWRLARLSIGPRQF